MTQILRKRLNKTTAPPHEHEPAPEGRAARAEVRHADELAQALRALATRAHQEVKVAASLDGASKDRMLLDLWDEIHRLQVELEIHGLDHLVLYVTALRQRIESFSSP